MRGRPWGMRIDLHTHSSVSDGTDAPAELVRKALAAGLDVVALTDHDTFDGLDEAVAEGERLELGVVRGMELSCSRRGSSVHVLAYGADPTSPRWPPRWRESATAGSVGSPAYSASWLRLVCRSAKPR